MGGLMEYIGEGGTGEKCGSDRWVGGELEEQDG